MRKVNTEGNRKRTTLTVIDVLCIIIIALICWAIVPNIMRALPLTPTTSGDVKLSYVITVTDVSEDVLKQIKSEQTVYDMTTGEVLGTISSIVHTPYIVKGVNQSTGELVPNTVDGRYNLNVTVTASAEEVDNSYQVNGITIACGMNYYFRTSTVALNGSCVSLKNR